MKKEKITKDKIKIKTMKMKIRNRYDFKEIEGDKEVPKGKSLTIQDDSYSIQEILERSARGFPPSLQANPIYNTDEDHFDADDLESLQRQDVTERWETMERVRQLKDENLAKYNEHLKKEEERKKELRKKNREQKAEFQKYLEGLKNGDFEPKSQKKEGTPQ